MTQTRAGFIAIIGAPNAGKSTLLNSLVGEKLAIVSPKVQTTRINLRGILTRNNCQYIFVDTPGIHKPRRNFDETMVDSAWEAFTEADATIMVVDARQGFTGEAARILENLQGMDKRPPLVLALNKIDSMPREKLLPLIADASALNIFDDIYPISARTGDGVDGMLKKLATWMPEGPYLYDPDDMTDMPMRILAAETTRERAFLLLGQELPYALAVETLLYEHQEDGSIRIEQNLLIERDGQKKIVIGKSGQMLKKIGSQSRAALEKFTGSRVHLFLHVKVKDWSNDPLQMRSLGVEPSKKRKR